MMNRTTPSGNRARVAIVGRSNSGKSSLMNALTGQRSSVVSEIAGTTTDPVIKPIELLDFGPVNLIDTAGLNDSTSLEGERSEATRKVMREADLLLRVVDGSSDDPSTIDSKVDEHPSVVVVNKCDLLSANKKEEWLRRLPEAIFVSFLLPETIAQLLKRIEAQLAVWAERERGLLDGILRSGARVLLVAPIDSEAPKGRLILPQVQLLRECLDRHLIATVVQFEELAICLDNGGYDLIVTDSQIFAEVRSVVKGRYPLTSFSILFARQKGDLARFVEGAKRIGELNAGDKVLIAECCTHTTSHEDIAHIKLPMLLQKRVGKPLVIDFVRGSDFPEELSTYRLVIHCGGCMITPRQMGARITACTASSLPITNFGTALAELSGMLDVALEPFQ